EARLRPGLVLHGDPGGQRTWLRPWWPDLEDHRRLALGILRGGASGTAPGAVGLLDAGPPPRGGGLRQRGATTDCPAEGLPYHPADTVLRAQHAGHDSIDLCHGRHRLL